MKKVLKIVVGGLVAIVFGFAGFVWWSLQPRPDPQPLPAALIAVTSPEGQGLLDDADAVADYQRLSESFEQQSLRSYCGVASGTIVLTALGRNVSQDDFFTDEASRVRSRLSVMLGGMSLPDFAALMNAHGAQVSTMHADTSSLEEFRAAVERNLSSEDDYLLVNYQREVLGQERVGHISPLAAYDRDSDKVLILDTAGYKYPPTWVPMESLFAAMSTIDSASGKSRGFIEISARSGQAF
jgi:hypothetical protein